MTEVIHFAQQEQSTKKKTVCSMKSFGCFLNCSLVYTGLACIITGIIGTLYAYSFSVCHFNKCQFPNERVIFMRVSGPLFLDLGVVLLVFAIYRLYQRRNSKLIHVPNMRVVNEETIELVVEEDDNNVQPSSQCNHTSRETSFPGSISSVPTAERRTISGELVPSALGVQKVIVPARNQPIGSLQFGGYIVGEPTAHEPMRFLRIPQQQYSVNNFKSSERLKTVSRPVRPSPYKKHKHLSRDERFHSNRHEKRSPKRLHHPNLCRPELHSTHFVTTIHEIPEQVSN